MLKFISHFFDSNEKEIKKLQPIIDEINSLEKIVQKLNDQDFVKKTNELKEKVRSGESIYSILPWAFALVREAANRTLGERHFDVQLISSIVLAQGKISEQKTGEGKTLSAVPALYLHALTGKTVHLVTVNDYLARRDAGWMGAIFNLLGLSVASIISERSFVYDSEYFDKTAFDDRLMHLRPIDRKEAYQKDVVYGINSEFGFDYLRDNMVLNQEDMVQTGHYFAIIDEVDSVLIDEARTPHIISMPDTQASSKYFEYAKIINKLSPQTDFKIDEKLRTAHLTEEGIEKIEKMFNVKDIYEKDYETVYHLEAALKARTLFHKDKDYIVRGNKVILVDEFTGRLLEGRRLSEGLHQAIEAKENVPIQQESKTLATVSLQNYFRMYEKIAGMTGTAATEAEEFHKIYKLEVVVVPTNRPMVRIDQGDLIYKTNAAKLEAIINEIEIAHKNGQPILVGTTSIDKNEVLSDSLSKRGIKHSLLNAKNHEKEAEIISNAGEKNAVTVATNMAGRGVDIILGGQPPSRFELKYQGTEGQKKYSEELKHWQRKHEEVIALGGLLVIGTEKHESRRIDNQLRGRSGRQGDPGRSVFVISLEDDLMRIFGGEQISSLMTRFNFPENIPLAHSLVSKVIEQAQIKVEGFNFEIRKNLLDYDDVLNKQREIIYKLRKKLVDEKEDVSVFVSAKVEEEIARIVNYNLEIGNPLDQIISEFVTIIPFDQVSRGQLLSQIIQLKNNDKIKDFLFGIAGEIETKRKKDFGEETNGQLLKMICLSAIDNLWMDHLTSIDDLRTGIGLRGYGQLDPLVEYKNEAYVMFERLITSIDDAIVHRVFRISFENAPIAQPKNLDFNNKEDKKPGFYPAKSGDKVGRNDPCPCGAIDPSTGKVYKYKKCGLINAPYHKNH